MLKFANYLTNFVYSSGVIAYKLIRKLGWVSKVGVTSKSLGSKYINLIDRHAWFAPVLCDAGEKRMKLL